MMQYEAAGNKTFLTRLKDLSTAHSPATTPLSEGSGSESEETAGGLLLGDKVTSGRLLTQEHPIQEVLLKIPLQVTLRSVRIMAPRSFLAPLHVG